MAEALATGEANLAGGTAWLWAREEMADAVDVLVIDEAGQMSLANTLAVCQAAGSLVLLGDPRQLDQPIQGVHPPGADLSALGHLLGESATVDPSRGVFPDQTWRMHPDICAFTTEQFYEGRLRPEPELRRQTLVGTGPLAGHGLRFIPRGACRQHERLGRGSRMRRGADPRFARHRRRRGRQAGCPETADP